jgi:O-antigen/teichoic acid export membrane protein
LRDKKLPKKLISFLKKDFTKDFIVYYLSGIASGALPFFLIQILTNYLSLADFGRVALFQSYISGLSAFVGVNVIGAVVKYKYEATINSRHISEYIRSAIHILIFSSFLILTVLLVLFITRSTMIDASNELLIYMAIIVSVSMFVVNLRMALWQISDKAMNYGIAQFLIQLTIFFSTYLLVVIFSMGYLGRVWAQVIAALIAAFASAFFLIKDGLLPRTRWLNFNLQDLNDLLKYGSALVPHVFGVFILANIDRFFLTAKLGLSELGIYFAAVQVALIFSLFLESMNNAFMPWLFAKLQYADYSYKRRIVRFTYYWFIILFSITVFVYIYIPYFVRFFFPEEYARSSGVLRILIVSQFFNGLYLMFTNYIFFIKKTLIISFITIISGIVNISLLLFFIDRWGIDGAALALMVSMMLRFILTWRLSFKLFPMPWF